jgi:ketosteroid isomerase-like protein
MADEVLETFAVTELFADEIHEVGELVVALGHIHARGGSSGVSLDSPSGWVVSIRDGRIASMHGYLDHEQALEAARAQGG